MPCKKHPKYLGKRYPWSECATCLKIWRNTNSKDEVLFKEVCNHACGCDAMMGYICNFCQNLRRPLAKVLNVASWY